MLKIPTLFKRDPTTFKVIPELTPGCAWVLEGKGMATIKLDGHQCKIININGKPQLQRRVKTGGVITYVPIDVNDPADQYLKEAFDLSSWWQEGIYECIGPKVNGNPQRVNNGHRLWQVVPCAGILMLNSFQVKFKRGKDISVQDFFDGIRAELEAPSNVEGIVFQWEDPVNVLKAAAKIKKKDFGIPWPLPEEKKVLEGTVVGPADGECCSTCHHNLADGPDNMCAKCRTRKRLDVCWQCGVCLIEGESVCCRVCTGEILETI